MKKSRDLLPFANWSLVNFRDIKIALLLGEPVDFLMMEWFSKR